MRTMLIDKQASFELKGVMIPMESPVGIIDGCTLELRYKLERFHRIGFSDEWFNVDTGDIVKVNFEFGD